MKRFWQFLALFVLVFALASCGGEQGGGSGGGGGSSDSGLTCAEDSTQSKCYDPATWDWKYNRYDFNGKGMSITILHGAPEELDPYNAGFTGNRKAERQQQFYQIQKAYNITLVIQKFPDAAAWGPDRVAWINSLAANKVTDQGEIFAISSDWVPSLVEGNSIVELEQLKFNSKTKTYDQVSGIFTDLNYEQSAEKNKQYSKSNKVYGYSNGTAHADFFLYYNQDLVNNYGLEDPATLWNEGRWDWTTFYNFLVTAQTAFDSSQQEGDSQMYAYGGWMNETVRGALAARGGKFIDPDSKRVLFTNIVTTTMYDDLRKIQAAGMWAPQANDVCVEFTAGNQLFQPAQLWFMTSTMRFASEDPANPTCDFAISLVPYPTADGDGEAKANYTIPMGADSGFAIRNVDNDGSGLTNLILINILDDVLRGIAPQYSIDKMTDEEAYRVYLQKIISSSESIEAVMSVENNIKKYGYTDYLDVVSKSVGNGSDWQGEGIYTWGETLRKLDTDVYSVLESKQPIYQAALEKILNE